MQTDPKNQDLIRQLKENEMIHRENQLLRLAEAVPDKNDLGEVEIVRGSRKKKPVERFSHSDYDETTGELKTRRNKTIVNYEEEFDYDDEDDDYNDLESDYNSEFDEEENLSSDSDHPHEPVSSRQKRQIRQKARAAMREIQDDEGVRILKSMLLADSSKIYTDEDLEKLDVLKKGLELVHCARVGLEYDTLTLVHIEVCYLTRIWFLDDLNTNLLLVHLL